MKRFKEFLIEGSSLDTTTFSTVHKRIYGDKSQELIADAQKRQQEQQGKSGDISNIVNLPDYNLKDKKSDILLLDKPPLKGKGIDTEIYGTADANRVTIYTKGMSEPKYLGTLAHEFSHMITPSWIEKPNSLAKNEVKDSFRAYSLSSSELPAFQSGYEAEYYTSTGKTLPSTMTDKEYDEFISWGEKTGKISKEHLEKMRDPKTRETMKELAKQVAKKGQSSSSVRDTSGGMAQA